MRCNERSILCLHWLGWLVFRVCVPLKSLGWIVLVRLFIGIIKSNVLKKALCPVVSVLHKIDWKVYYRKLVVKPISF
jgi:hypothetical protein